MISQRKERLLLLCFGSLFLSICLFQLIPLNPDIFIRGNDGTADQQNTFSECIKTMHAKGKAFDNFDLVIQAFSRAIRTVVLP